MTYAEKHARDSHKDPSKHHGNLGADGVPCPFAISLCLVDEDVRQPGRPERLGRCIPYHGPVPRAVGRRILIPSRHLRKSADGVQRLDAKRLDLPGLGLQRGVKGSIVLGAPTHEVEIGEVPGGLVLQSRLVVKPEQCVCGKTAVETATADGGPPPLYIGAGIDVLFSLVLGLGHGGCGLWIPIMWRGRVSAVEESAVRRGEAGGEGSGRSTGRGGVALEVDDARKVS